MRRDSYENLNGLWKYAITQTAEYPAAWDGSILVPYSPETKASGCLLYTSCRALISFRLTVVPGA